MADQRLRCWPTLKSTILKHGPIFQMSDILYTGTEIKYDIICRKNLYVKCIYDHLKYKNNFKSLPLFFQ